MTGSAGVERRRGGGGRERIMDLFRITFCVILGRNVRNYLGLCLGDCSLPPSVGDPRMRKGSGETANRIADESVWVEIAITVSFGVFCMFLKLERRLFLHSSFWIRGWSGPGELLWEAVQPSSAAIITFKSSCCYLQKPSIRSDCCSCREGGVGRVIRPSSETPATPYL